MVFLVIDKEFVNKIFTDYDSNIDIDMIEFETKEEAEYYLEYGKFMPRDKVILPINPKTGKRAQWPKKRVPNRDGTEDN